MYIDLDELIKSDAKDLQFTCDYVVHYGWDIANDEGEHWGPILLKEYCPEKCLLSDIRIKGNYLSQDLAKKDTLSSVVMSKDGSSFLDFMRRVPPPSDKSSIPPNGGVGSGWGNQTMGNYRYGIVRK